jgi:ADP-ribose pyrophosphatase YjhB (NUDIX family)
MERGELPTEAAVRETREETGLDVTVERLVGVYGKADVDEIVFAFACRAVGGQLTATDEADACEYFALERVPRNTIPRHVERIHDALSPDAPPAFRRQTVPSTREHLRNLKAAGLQENNRSPVSRNAGDEALVSRKEEM